MNKKNFMDMMICSLSAAIIILCFTYMEQSRGRDTFTAICGIVFLAFLLLAVMDSLPTKRKRGANGRGIQELLLLDEAYWRKDLAFDRTGRAQGKCGH